MTEIWFVPVILRIVIIYTVYPWFRKAKLIHTSEVSFIVMFALHYFFAALLGSATALLLGQLNFDKTTMFIMAIGAANGFGAYCQWRADQYSMSFGALAGFMDDVIAVSLGYFILNESQYLNIGITNGLIICAIAVGGLAICNYYKKKTGKEHLGSRFFGYVLGYTVIWGFATFLMRYLAISDVPIGKFVFGWYGGASLTAFAIFCISKLKSAIKAKKKRDEKDGMDKEIEPVSVFQTLWMTATAGAMIFVNIFLSYWAFKLAPIVVLKPVGFVSAMVPPMLVGLFLFNEKSQYESLIEKSLILLAVIGAVFIAFSFRG